MGPLDFRPTFKVEHVHQCHYISITFTKNLILLPCPLVYFFISIMAQQEIQFPSILFVCLFWHYLFLCGVGWVSQPYRFGSYCFSIAISQKRPKFGF